MTHTLIVDLSFVAASEAQDTDEAFEAFADRVYTALLDLEKVDSGICDPDITASLVERKMSIMMGVEASTHADAVRLFMANVRTALHAAECNTANWPHYKTVTDDIPPIRRADFVDV